MSKNAASKTTSKTTSSSAKQSTSERSASEKMNYGHGAKSYGQTRDCRNAHDKDEYEDEE